MAFLNPVGYLITAQRLPPVSGQFKEKTETETEKFQVGVSVGYNTQNVFWRHVRTPVERKRNLRVLGSQHINITISRTTYYPQCKTHGALHVKIANKTVSVVVSSGSDIGAQLTGEQAEDEQRKSV